MHFVNLEKAFDRVPTKVLELVMRKKGITEVYITTVTSGHDREKTAVCMGSELSSLLSKSGHVLRTCVVTFSFAAVVDVTKFAR